MDKGIDGTYITKDTMLRLKGLCLELWRSGGVGGCRGLQWTKDQQLIRCAMVFSGLWARWTGRRERRSTVVTYSTAKGVWGSVRAIWRWSVWHFVLAREPFEPNQRRADAVPQSLPESVLYYSSWKVPVPYKAYSAIGHGGHDAVRRRVKSGCPLVRLSRPVPTPGIHYLLYSLLYRQSQTLCFINTNC